MFSHRDNKIRVQSPHHLLPIARVCFQHRHRKKVQPILDIVVWTLVENGGGERDGVGVVYWYMYCVGKEPWKACYNTHDRVTYLTNFASSSRHTRTNKVIDKIGTFTACQTWITHTLIDVRLKQRNEQNHGMLGRDEVVQDIHERHFVQSWVSILRTLTDRVSFEYIS